MKDEAYLEAEQKIQQALQSGATELDLSSMKFEVRSARSDEPDGDQWLTVLFEDGYLFTSLFLDWTVLLVFISRPSLSNAPVEWHGTQYKNVSEAWERLPEL